MALTESDIKIIIAAELKNKGFKDAEKASNSLNTQFKKLGKTVLTVFGTREIIQFGKAAVAAFTEDEVAARRFEQALKGVNLGFATPALENYLETLERQTAVTKGELRPAFQQLASTTRSVAMSQDILNTALDVAAGTGIDLSTVVNDLSRSFLGNNTSLSKYNLGLSRTELRTKSFSEIQELLNEQFSGQRAAFLETYAGKVSLLQAGYERMQTTVGQGLVDAFQILSGDQGIGAGISAMEMFAEKIADTTRGIAGLITSFGSFQSYASTVLQFVKGLASERSVIGAIASIGEKNRPLFFPTAGVGQPAIDRRLAAIEEEAIKRQKELEKLRLKALREQEKANRLKRIAIQLMEKEKKFDLTRIQLQAALQGKLTDEERRRIEELMKIEEIKEAISAGDADKAEQLMDELKELQAETTKLATMLTKFPKANNPFEDWYSALEKINAMLASILSLTNAQNLAARSSGSAGNAAMALGDYYAAQGQAGSAAADAALAIAAAQAAIGAAKTPQELEAANEFLRAANESAAAAELLGESAAAMGLAAANADLLASADLLGESIAGLYSAGINPNNITVNIAGSVTTEQDLIDAVTQGLYQVQKRGQSITLNAVAI